LSWVLTLVEVGLVPGFRTDCHDVGESAPPAGDPGAHRSRCELENLGDLGVVESGDVSEDDWRPELLGKAGEGKVDIDSSADRLAGIAGATAADVSVVGVFELG